MSLEKIFEIALKDIDISPLNVRHSQQKKDLDELVASIKKHSLLQPIVLMGNAETSPYKLIAGQRRYLAHEQLKKKTIRAVFVGKLNKDQAILRSLVENLQRLPLNHADSAKAITTLYKSFNKDERMVQRETGLSIRKIRDYIRIDEQASPKMKRKLKDKKASTADLKRTLKAAQGDTDKAEELLDLMEKHPLTKYQKKRITDNSDKNRNVSAKKIIEEAIKPRIEESILVSLPKEVRDGLDKATKALSIEADEIITQAIQEWLNDQGFLNA